MIKSFAAETVAEAYLALLKDRGIDRLFLNGGTDFASVVEAYAHAKDTGLDLPEPVVCPHENLAVSMAHGAYLANGRPQAVMLHTSVGTANGMCGIFNAARDRIPILLTAGRTPLYEHTAFGSRNGQIHWAQEMYDQAGMLREFVKWDYELRGAGQVEEVVDRAVSLAMSEPRGPIYLSLPREVLAETVEGFDVRDTGPAVPSESHPDPASIAELADLLAGAHFPVIVTAATGADRRTVPLLDALCERFSIAVLENRPRYMNVSGEHPLHIGFQINPVFAEADVLVFIDLDVPWSPGAANPREDATVVQCGIDPLFARYPIRSHRSDLTIMATTHAILEALTTQLQSRASGIDPARYERIAAVAAARRNRRDAALAAESKAGGRINKLFMNWALAEVRPPDAVIVNEYWSQPEIAGAHNAEPGTYFDTPPAGGLGWGLPAAMGIQIASPGRTVIATLGDGAYMFANPAACHQAMAANDLPVLSIISNNEKWGAVDGSARGMYPEGFNAMAGELTALARLDPAPRYEMYATASGGHAEYVAKRAALVPALERALHAVRSEHRHAVVNVVCE